MYSPNSDRRPSWTVDGLNSSSPTESSSSLGLYGLPSGHELLTEPDLPEPQSLPMQFNDPWPSPSPLEPPFEPQFLDGSFGGRYSQPSPLTPLDLLPPEHMFPPYNVGQHSRNLPNIQVDMSMLTVGSTPMPPRHLSPSSPAAGTPYLYSGYQPRGSIGVHSSPSSTGTPATPSESPLAAFRGLDAPYITGYSRTPPRSPVDGNFGNPPTPCLNPVQYSSVPELAQRSATQHDGPLVPQKIYRPHTQSDRRRYVEEVQLEAPIMFHMLEPQCCGIPLSDAITSKFMRLVGRDDLMFQGRGPSVSIRLMWPGYAPWSRQIPTRDFRSPPGPITRAKLAKNVAKTVQRFIDEMKIVPMEDDADPRWRVGPHHIRLEHLVLVGLQHVSMGSWQAFVRVRPQVLL